MNRARPALIAAAILLSTSTPAEEQTSGAKTYVCGDEEMKLTQLDDGRLALDGKGLTGHVSVHRATGMYRGSVDGWGSQHKTPREALDAACRWLLRKAATQSEEALKKELDKFYQEWKWEPQ